MLTHTSRRIFLSTIFAGSVAGLSSAVAQTPSNEGVAIYQRTLDLHASLAPAQQTLKAVIPKEQVSQLEVRFSGHRFLISPPIEQENATLRLSSGTEEYIIVDTEQNTVTRYGTISDFNYIVRSELTPSEDVQPLAETKTVAGYEVKGIAVTPQTPNGDTQETKLWRDDTAFFSASPLPNGYGKGLVAEMSVNAGQIKIVLEEVRFENINAATFDVPEGHREISQEQFADLQEEAIEALRNNSSTRVIRRRVEE